MRLVSFELDFRKTSGQDSEMKMGQFVELSKSGFCLVPKLVLIILSTGRVWERNGEGVEGCVGRMGSVRVVSLSCVIPKQLPESANMGRTVL